MTIHVPTDLRNFIVEAVSSGRFSSEEDLVREALTRLQKALEVTSSTTIHIGDPAPRDKPLTKEALQRHLSSIGLVDQPARAMTGGGTRIDEEEVISEEIIRERLIEWLTGFLSK
jgi:Arc/MetJ-type ribon-helix-helix transcriptional regulator